MKATELQINDWIMLKGGAHQVSYLTNFDFGDARVAVVSNDYDGNPYLLDSIEPIPLTLDILKANDFTIDDSLHAKYYHWADIQFDNTTKKPAVTTIKTYKGTYNEEPYKWLMKDMERPMSELEEAMDKPLRKSSPKKKTTVKKATPKKKKTTDNKVTEIFKGLSEQEKNEMLKLLQNGK